MLDTLEGVLVIVLNEGLSNGGVMGTRRIIESDASTESEGRRNDVSKDASTPSWSAIEYNEGEGKRIDDSYVPELSS
jgi:hypothetical protein